MDCLMNCCSWFKDEAPNRMPRDLWPAPCVFVVFRSRRRNYCGKTYSGKRPSEKKQFHQAKILLALGITW